MTLASRLNSTNKYISWFRMENFVLYDELGRGEQRVVHKGRRKGTVNYFAIHCVEKTKRDDLQNSVRISHNLSHKHIVQFYEWYETSNHLWLVVELCSGISLEGILSQDRYLPEETVRKFGRDIAEALAYLHSHNIVYCDLSPSKIILDGSGILKLSNFTLAKVNGEPDDFDDSTEDLDIDFGHEESLSKRLLRALPFYIAPEILKGGSYTKQSDLWSFGCLMFECFTGKPPYVATQFDDLLSLITSKDVPCPIQEKGKDTIQASNELTNLISRLLVKEPLDRISLEDLCLHNFWQGTLSNILYRSGTEPWDECKDSQSITQHSSLDEKRSYIIGMESLEGNMELENVSYDKNSEIKDTLSDSRPKTISALGKGFAHLDLSSVGRKSIESSTRFATPLEAYSHSRESKQKTDLYGSFEKSNLSGNSQGNGIEMDKSDVGVDVNLIDLLYHPSDLEVNPIIENPRHNKQNAWKWDSHFVPLQTIKADRIQQLTRQDAEQHVDAIIEAFISLSHSIKGGDMLSTQKSKIHLLAYLCSLSRVETLANLLIEKNVTKFLLHDLKSTSSQEIKHRAGYLLGVLACSATYISPNFRMNEIFSALTESIRDNLCNTNFKVALLSALGEFMFYAATQEEGENKRIANWDPPGASFTIIARSMQQGEDVSVQHMAARIVENIATTAGRYCKKFLLKDVAISLWNLFSHSVTDAEKLTAISALSRLSMHSNAIFQQVIEHVGIEQTLKIFFASSTRMQQYLLTGLITLLPNPTYFKRIKQDPSTIGKFTRILETPSLVLRGKVYLFLSEICGKSPSALLESCQAKLVTYVERDTRKALSGKTTKTDKHAFLYLKKCLELGVSVILKQLPLIMNGIIKALDATSGRHHPPASSTKQLRATLPNLSTILHVVTSQVFRPRLINDNFLQAIGELLHYISRIDIGEINISASLGSIRLDDVVGNTFSIVEAISQHPFLLLQYRETVLHSMLPSLGSFIASSSGDSRILAMKLFSDICSLYLENEECAKSARGQIADKTYTAMNKVIGECVLNRLGSILQDQDPIPAFALKLLHLFIDRNADAGSLLVENGLLSKTIDLFEAHQNDTRSSALLAIVNAIASMVAVKSLDVNLLCDQGLVEYLMSAFIAISSVLDEDVDADHASSMFIPLLDTLRHLLRGLEAGVKRVVRSREEERDKGGSSHEVAQVEEQLSSCKVLTELNGVLITLLCFDDLDVQDWSCQCLYLSAELFGGENEEAFSEENLECLTDAVQLFDDKKKKLLLRVVKRFITSSMSLRKILIENGGHLCQYLVELCSKAAVNADQKSVRTTASEILTLLQNK